MDSTEVTGDMPGKKQGKLEKPNEWRRFMVPIFVQRILLEYSEIPERELYESVRRNEAAASSLDSAGRGTDGDGAKLSEHTISTGQIRKKLREIYHMDVSSDMVRDVLKALRRLYERDSNAADHYGTNLVSNMQMMVKSNEPVEASKTEGDFRTGDNIASAAEADDEDHSGKKKDKRRPTYKQWYQVSHDFDQSEVAYLVALCASSSGGVNGDQSLYAKLGALLSQAERKEVLGPEGDGSLYGISHSAKNRDVDRYMKLTALISTMRTIDEAIAERRTIIFDYPDTLKNPQEYKPYCVDVIEGYTYVMVQAKTDKNPTRPLRVDRMSNVRIGDSFIDGGTEDEKQANEEAYRKEQGEAERQFRASANRMFHECDNVHFRFKHAGSKKIVEDNFGHHEGFYLSKHKWKDGFFHCRLYVSTEGFQRWVMKRPGEYEVIEPWGLRDAIRDELLNNRYVNPDDESFVSWALDWEKHYRIKDPEALYRALSKVMNSSHSDLVERKGPNEG